MYLRFYLICTLFAGLTSGGIAARPIVVDAFCDSLYRTKDQAAQEAMLRCYRQQLNQRNATASQSALIHYRMAQGYAFLGAFSDAITAYQTAIEVVDDPVQRLHFQEELAFAYQTYGRSLDKALELREALLLSILEEHQPPSEAVLSIWCENHIRLAILHQQMGNWDIASSYFQEAEYLVYELGKDRLTFFFQLNWAYFLLESGQPQKACTLIKSCWQEQAAKGRDRLIERLFAQVLLGQVYLALHQPAQALPLLLSARQDLLERNQGDFLFHIYIRQEISACYLALEQWEAAQAVLQESIEQLEAHTANDYTQVNILTLAALYEQQAQVIHQAAGKQDEERAFRKAWQAFQYLEQALASFSSAGDQQQQLADSYPVIETLLELVHDQYQRTGDTHYVDVALHAMELSQNLLLRAQLLPYPFSDCAPHLYQEWQSARRQLHQLQLQVRTRKAFRFPRRKEAEVHHYHELVAQQERCRQLMEQYQQNCRLPVTDQAAFVGVRQLSRQLEQDESLIQFALGDRSTFVLVVNQEDVRFHRLDQGIEEWEQQLQTFRDQLYQSVRSGAEDDWQDWAKSSRYFYQQLLAPFEEVLTEKLILIPDGPLWQLPFAALIRETATVGEATPEPPFILYQHAISYRYSNRFTFEPAGGRASAREPRVLAFAPDFPAVRLANTNRSASLSALNNHWEVERIARYFPTELVKGAEANVEKFWSLAPHYSILHLATHAVANTETGHFSYLAIGEEQKLEASDLYGRQLAAELVVLSACETALGEWQRGEGLIGLQRAFFAMGARSLASTQWKVSDESSALLMDLFYEQLAQGRSKDEALRAAQLAFIDRFPDQTHPFYWAAFTLLGDTVSLEPGDSSRNRRWLIVLGLIFACIVIQKRRHAS